MSKISNMGRVIGALLAKMAHEIPPETEPEERSADNLEKKLLSLTNEEQKQTPVNAKSDYHGGTEAVGDQVIWGPEVAPDSRNDLSTWGGYDSVSRY